ncbi:DEAD/DEAH box helicase [Nocardia sp. N2S4-5]|uniref:DEAD/DEAH box helicase n=1 Tax=Nocardia sp. N2S4-5 TaxID=3351565 RepID=UPI0037D18474
MGDGIALNPVEQARQVFESLPDPARGVVEAVVFGGNLPRTEITRMRELADGLRARAGALGEHAQDAGSILAQQDSVGAFADGLREMLRSHEDGAGKLSEQALTLADQADGAANEAEKTICVMFAFGVELVFRIIRMLAAASAAGPAGQMAALPAVEATLVEGRAEAQLMRAGLKEAYGRLAAKTTAALSAMGPVRFAVTAIQSAALPMIVDGGVQVLQVAAGDRNFDPIGDERENPTGFDVTSILVAGAAGAGGAAGGTLAAKVGPKMIPRMETSRTLAGLVHGTAGAAAGLTAAAMITGWPEDYQHILAPMLNGAFAGTVHAQPGAHSRPGPAAGPVVDGGGMFTPPDSFSAGPPIKISAESRQAWETARAAWKAQPANTTAGGAGDPGAVAAGPGAAPVPSVATAPSVLAAAALAPVAAAAHPSGTTPASSGAVASAPAAAQRAPGGDEVARGAAPAGPRVTSGAETAAPPKVPTSTTTRAGDDAVPVPAQPRDGEGQGSAAAHDARAGEHARGEGENSTAPGGEGEGTATSARRPGEGEQGDADGGTRSEQRGEDSVANDDAASGHPRGSKGEDSVPARRAADEGEGAVAEDGVATGQPRGTAEPNSVAEEGVRTEQRQGSEEPGPDAEHGARDEQRAEGEDATTQDGAHSGQRGEGAQPADGSEDGAAGGQRPGNENPGATAEDGAPAAEAGKRAGTSGDEGAGSRDRADEVLADFHARSGEDVPEALKLSNMPDEVLQAGLFHEDAHESLIAGMEIIRRHTTDETLGGMVLRTTQLEGRFEMDRRLVEMPPGQGKTLMFMSYSLHQAVRHGSTLLVTTVDGLAHREFTEYKRILSRYGIDALRADQNTGFGRVTPGRPAIVVATGETVGHLCNAGHTPPRRVVIDEIDAIFDRGRRRTSNPKAYRERRRRPRLRRCSPPTTSSPTRSRKANCLTRISA